MHRPRSRQLLVWVLLVALSGVSQAATRKLLSAQDNVFSGQAAALRDIARQERSETMMQHISKAAASGGDKQMVAHATEAATRAGDDSAMGVGGHVDRRRLLSAQDNVFSGQAAALRDIARQERSETMMQHISKAAASGGDKQMVAHATEAATRAGDDSAMGVGGHVDRRRRRRLAAWLLLGAQESLLTNSFQLQEPLRQQRAAEMSARIKAAVAAGGDRQTMAGFRTGDRRMLQDDTLGAGSLSDGLRGSDRLKRAAVSASMIRQAAAGEMDVREAIRMAQATPGRSGITLAQRAAGPAQQLQGRARP